jgi:hypothetical protein
VYRVLGFNIVAYIYLLLGAETGYTDGHQTDTDDNSHAPFGARDAMSEQRGSESRGDAANGENGEPPAGMGQWLPAPLRLRSAGVGVVVAGIALAGLSVVLPYATAASLLAGGGAAGVLTLRDDPVSVQLSLGVGMLGAIALTEAITDSGLGLGPVELAGLAVLFGLLDIVAGTLVERFRSDSG